MIINMLIGLAVMVFCLFIQALLVAMSARFYTRHTHLALSPSFTTTVVLIGGVMMMLVAGNFLQIFIWAGLYLFLGEFESASVAIYHSAVNFSTLGYGDIVMSERHRILGPRQAVIGVLMIGVSTAVTMTAFQNALRLMHQARQNKPQE